MSIVRKLCVVMLAAVLPAFLCAQEQKQDDKYVRLMSAQSVSSYEEDGKTLRRAEGPARFLHNDTWLICDTAIWDVDLQVIYALGNVSIEQENTELRSDKLTYYIERDIAEFRGSVVELIDKDQNTLRTRHLDYNTKDSLAIFRNGASMRDKDGQIIESLDGEYDSKAELFTFTGDVNMFSDSVFVKTSKLLYESKLSLATFPNYVDAWNADRMMSGDRGNYDNAKGLFFMTGNVHTTTDVQEGWCDSLYFHKTDKSLELLSNAQITDTTRSVTGLAGFISYRDSLSRIVMHDDPLLFTSIEEKDTAGVVKLDSVYVRADSIRYWSIMRKDIDKEYAATAAERIKELSSDPVANIRQKAREEAERRRKEAQGDEDDNLPPGKKQGSKGSKAPEAAPSPATDSLAVQVDSLSVGADSLARVDSLSLADTLRGPQFSAEDSVKLSHIRAFGNVKVFRRTMQMVCDSLEYSDVDSLARLYKLPAVWNGPKHQYIADSIFVLIHNKTMERANLLSNAFIHVEEEKDKYYDQVKSTEMAAYFNADGQMVRFDALGGANALFYMKEKEEFSLANRSEATMLTASFVDGELNSLSYYENPTSDAYPIPQMTRDLHRLRGFNWTPDRRPRGVWDLSMRVPRSSQRSEYEKHPRAQFVQTGIYFSGYMDGIYRQIEVGDSLRKVHERNKRLREQQLRELKAVEAGDSTAVTDSIPAMLNDSTSLAVNLKSKLDSLSAVDSLGGVQDSLSVRDTLGVSDSLVVKTPKQIKQELREKKRKEREAKRQAAIDKREARWAAKDARDALKQAARDAKKQEKKEALIKKQIARFEKEKAREDALVKKFKEKYLKKNL